MRMPDPSVTNVRTPIAQWLYGSLFILIGIPLTLVFVDRLVNPGARSGQTGSTLAQLAIALVILIGGVAGATWRRRVTVDGRARTVTWTRHVFGRRISSEIWPAADIEAVVLKTAYQQAIRFSRRRFFSVFLIGKRGRRPMRLDAVRREDLTDAQEWARRLDVPLLDRRDDAQKRRS